MTTCSPCASPTLVFYKGEDITLTLRVTDEKQNPVDLTPFTEIRALFKLSDGQTLTRSLTESQITVLDAPSGKLQISLSSLDTNRLIVAESQNILLIFDQGSKATATVPGDTDPIVFTAKYPGLDGNSIALQFDGADTVTTVVDNHNAIPSNPKVTFSPSTEELTILSQQVVLLSGATGGRRIAKIDNAYTMEDLTL